MKLIAFGQYSKLI